MVTIRLVIEGGADATEISRNATASGNTQALRQAFNQLFSQIVDQSKVRIMIDMGATWTTTKTQLLQSPSALGLFDMDGDETRREEKLVNVLQLGNYRSRVFFMIQTMEGWILSQPDKIEECFKNYKKPTAGKIEDETYLKGIPPVQIVNPATKLNTILARHFKDKQGQKLKYGKLKNSYLLIKCLDMNKLYADFTDAKALIDYIKLI